MTTTVPAPGKATTDQPAPEVDGPAAEPDQFWEVFRKPIPPMYAMVIIGLLVGFFYLIMEPWTVGGGETEIAGLMAYAGLGHKLLAGLPFWNGQVFYIDPLYWKLWISLGLFAGGLFGAITGRDFKFRVPGSKTEWLLGAVGGLLMGFGIRLSYICNVSTFFGTATGLNLAGYLAILGILVGGYVGAKIYARIVGV